MRARRTPWFSTHGKSDALQPAGGWSFAGVGSARRRQRLETGDLRGEQDDLRIMAMTANAMKADLDACLDAGNERPHHQPAPPSGLP
jgi:hypothetical protein